MATQALSTRQLGGTALEAWVGFLRSYAGIRRRLNGDLLADHGLTLNDYEVLLHLAHAPDRRLRRIDLANHVLLTPSGITRLLEGLERAGYVEKAACSEDARVIYAVLTDAGLEQLTSAAATHVAGIRALFVDRFSDGELERLASLLGRLPLDGSVDESCEP